MLKAKVTIQDSCNAKLEIAKMIEAKDDERTVGTIVGIVYDTVERKSPDGSQVFTGLSGQFEVTPTDAEKESIESGILFLPDAFLAVVRSALDRAIYVPNEDGSPNYEKKRKGSIQFAGEIVLKTSKNAAGYEWGLKMVKAPNATDPLAELKASLPKPGTPKAIANNSKAKDSK